MADKRESVHITNGTHKQLKEYVDLRGLKIKNVADAAISEFLARNKKEEK